MEKVNIYYKIDPNLKREDLESHAFIEYRL